jgi:hypothetical protein
MIKKRCADVGIHCAGNIKLPDWPKICEDNPKFVYFQKENERKNGGKEYLVLRSCYQSEFIPGTHHLHPDDTRLFLKIGQLVSASTRFHWEILGEILRLTMLCSKRVDDGSFNSLPLPQSGADLRKQFVQNKNSLLNVIPHPSVDFIVSEDIAISKFQEILADFLAHGAPFEGLTRSQLNPDLAAYLEQNPDATIELELGLGKLTSLSSHEQDASWRSAYECSDVGDSILSQSMYFQLVKRHDGITPTLFLCVDVWFDDCDPNNQSKKNRGSVFLRTLTFSPSRKFRNNLKNTYPYAVGHKSSSRSAVDKRFQEELLFVNGVDETGARRRFFCAAIGTDVAVTVKLRAKLADQPEKRSALGLSGGNSVLHPRFGLIINLNGLENVVAPCATCRARMYGGDRDWDKIQCAACTQWEMDGEHPLLCFNVPDGFPLSELTEEERLTKKMRPRKLTLENLRLAAQKAGDKLVDGTWQEQESCAYMKSFGINDKWISAVVRFAIIKANMCGNVEDNSVLEEMTESELEQAEAILLSCSGGVPIPSAWQDDVRFFQNLDVPMHLLFLGVVQTAIDIIFLWCKQKRKFTDLMNKSKGIMDEIHELRVDWCKAMPLTNGKFGAWVSEQYLAFSKVLVWWFGLLDCVEDEPEYQDPAGHHSGWNRKDGVSWLRARQLNIGGNAQAIKERVTAYMTQEGGAPPVADGGTAGVGNVQDLVRSLYAVVSLAMTETITEQHVGNLKFAIKRFMTDFEIMDLSLRPKRKKPRWVTTYNIAGLQNIIETMWLVGPLRNFWEGGFKGEGYLRFMKQEITMGLRLNWQVNLLKRLFRRIAMARLLEEEELQKWMTNDESDDEEEEEGFHVGYSDFRCYAEQDLVEKKWVSMSALSAVVLKDESFRVVVDSRRQWYALVLNNTAPPAIESNGMIYGHYTMCGPYKADLNLVSHGCMFLPHLPTKLAGNRDGGSPYTIIRSDWKIWNGFEFGDISL